MNQTEKNGLNRIFFLWKQALSKKEFIVQLIIVAILATFSMYVIGFWLSYNETRVSTPLDDPILAQFTPIDLSKPIALVNNIGCLIGLISALLLPFKMIQTLTAITLLGLVRVIAMYLVPLEPPVDIIPLRDFVIESMFYGGKVLTKDLFFSGHTAFLVLLCLLAPHKRVRWLLAVISTAVGVMLILQHVHYTIDVVLAPFFSLFVYIISKKIVENYFKRNAVLQMT